MNVEIPQRLWAVAASFAAYEAAALACAMNALSAARSASETRKRCFGRRHVLRCSEVSPPTAELGQARSFGGR
jgi:hypothetical protein